MQLTSTYADILSTRTSFSDPIGDKHNRAHHLGYQKLYPALEEAVKFLATMTIACTLHLQPFFDRAQKSGQYRY